MNSAGGSASSNAHSSKRTVLTSRTPRIRFLPGGSDIDSTVLHSPGGERKKSRRRRGQNHAWLGGNRRVVGLLLVGLSLVLWWVGKGRLWGRPPLRIPSRPYSVQPYLHLDFSKPISLRPATRVFHVTKEFGPATMGGLGVMLTALAIAQSESPYLSISVILPYYSWLRTDNEFSSRIKHFANIHVSVDSGGQPKRVGCAISLLKWEYTSQTDFLTPNFENDGGVKDIRFIDIYLIGPGDESPFHVAFQSKDAGDIYSAYKPLKQEWKDLWFAKAATELIAHLSYDDGSTLFVNDGLEDFDEDEEELPQVVKAVTPDGAQEEVRVRLKDVIRGVDVVHLHGATNAMVALYLLEMEHQDLFGERPPAIVYTLHDSLDEVEYSNLVSNARSFVSSDILSTLSFYTFGKQVFTSSIGIDFSDMVTFVSKSIAAALVEGRFAFALRDLILPSITTRAQTRSFVGITNGLDFTDPKTNPFTSPVLVQRHLSFPRVGVNVTNTKSLWTGGDNNPRISKSQKGYKGETGLTAVSFSHTKDRAKAYLIESLPTLFSEDDLKRPFFLFIGRFQYNKGCQFFEPLLKLFSDLQWDVDARLIVMGSRNNYPSNLLQALRTRYPNHLTFIDNSTVQNDWGTIIRMASDFAFVPSFSEAFGLVAAEGLLFGMPVVSTGVGGLMEFLEPMSFDMKRGNSYLFSLFHSNNNAGSSRRAKRDEGIDDIEEEDFGVSAENTRQSVEELASAIEAAQEAIMDAVRGWKKRVDPARTGWVEREMFVRRMVADALKLKWSREKGPVEEYIRVYDQALRSKRPNKPPPGRLPISGELLEGALGHPIDSPSIAHGGHGKDSGPQGVEALERAQVRALPIYKVWTSNQDSKDQQGGAGQKLKAGKQKKGQLNQKGLTGATKTKGKQKKPG